MQPEVTNNDTQAVISKMIFLLGLNSELQLADFLSVERSAISKWKKRGKIPSKHLQLVDEIVTKRADAIDSIFGVSVSVQEVMDALGMEKDSTWIYKYKQKNPRLYELIEDGIRIEKIRATKLAVKMGKHSMSTATKDKHEQ